MKCNNLKCMFAEFWQFMTCVSQNLIKVEILTSTKEVSLCPLQSIFFLLSLQETIIKTPHPHRFCLCNFFFTRHYMRVAIRRARATTFIPFFFFQSCSDLEIVYTVDFIINLSSTSIQTFRLCYIIVITKSAVSL